MFIYSRNIIIAVIMRKVFSFFILYLLNCEYYHQLRARCFFLSLNLFGCCISATNIMLTLGPSQSITLLCVYV